MTDNDAPDFLNPKSWASLCALGPILAGIAWAFGVYLGAPTGYALLAGAGVFSLFVVLAHSGNGTASKLNLLALFLAGTMILFWQGALCSTAGGAVAAEADSQAPAVSLGDLFVPDAMAGGQAAVLFTVEKHGGQYEVRRDGSLWEVPVDVYQAIAQYERRQRKGFGVRF